MYGMGNNGNSNGFKLIGVILLALFGGWIAIKIIGGVLGFILGLIVPIAIIGGVGFVLYSAFGKKALGGGRRTLP